MALREFTGRDGVRWKVWDITPEALHPSTRAEDYLQGFLDGWLVFESADGADKRRLYPVPRGWDERDDSELERLWSMADAVRAKHQRVLPTESPRKAEAPAADLVVDPHIRTFRYPGGRVWTVAEVPVLERSDEPGSRPSRHRVVLRFSSGARVLDLFAWPHWWPDLNEQELADLLWRAFPRDPGGENPTSNSRRRGDQHAKSSGLN